jgi:hypothetical protein
MLLATSEFGMVLIAVVLIALPLAALMFATGAARGMKEIGKGGFAIDHDMPRSTGAPVEEVSPEVREEEIRQMIQARSDRGVARGGKALDVDAEVEKVLAHGSAGPSLGGDRELREEVRQLVIARNERRERQGKKPLDVEKEIGRQLRDLENLGQ